MNCFRVLGITADATQDEIKAAYKRRARQTHPDLNNRASDDEFPEVAEAFAILTDPLKRKEWEEEYRATAEGLGYVVCDHCFAIVRLRRFKKHEKPKCGECRTPLRISPEERENKYREAIVYQVGELVEAIGAEGAALAKDAIVAGANALRKKFGLTRN